MQEIKFRLWSGIKMHDHHEAVRKLWDIACGVSTYPEDVVLRFTGKQDKNKTEIYEGDILRLHDSHEFSKKNPYNFGIVCFGDGNYDTGFYEFVGFYLKIPNVYFDGDGYQWPEDKPFDEDGYAGWLFDTDGIEVIDNIYENKLKIL